MKYLFIAASCLAACSSKEAAPSAIVEDLPIGLGRVGVVEAVSRPETCPEGWTVDVHEYSTTFHCRSDRDFILISTYPWGWIESIVIVAENERDATRQFDQIAPLLMPEVAVLLRPTIHRSPGSGAGGYIRPDLSCAAGPVESPTHPYLVQWIEMKARSDPWWFKASNP